MSGNAVVPGALGVPAVAVKGTAADTRVKDLVPGDFLRFQALVRLHVPTILDNAGSTAKDIALPIEFVLLDVE